jgi:hypothetical protein
VTTRRTDDDAVAYALVTALRSRVPWWLRLRIRIDRDAIYIRHRVLIRLTSGSARLPRYDPETDMDNVLLSVQSDIWNACHRKWPVHHEKLGGSCSFEELPSPESRLSGDRICLRFIDQGEVLRLAAIRIGTLP